MDKKPEMSVDKLLLEKLPLAGIAPSYWGIASNGCFPYVNAKYSSVPKAVEVWQKKKTIDYPM